MSVLTKARDLLTASASTNDDDESGVENLDEIASITSRRPAHCLGTVSSIVVQPAGQDPKLDVDLHDGTGRLALVWLGRQSIAGIEPGARLEVEGFVGLRGRKRIMYNPRYAIHGAKDDGQ
ncbi:hypothetical protein DAD186_11990 [Dermabacter vaginalis]|uniref:DNA-binding protein n=1 Tax=Dermabacter vaginalis TaxID=1630135 RepID=A0A1B0ZID0_9MICO|nr:MULTISPECIES: OB-fold nucleic acid binding domain-containing protein [Dermabacter]ANP27749.1 hypothetical protein DAD186_11990 [Dermabacter vaginalis]